MADTIDLPGIGPTKKVYVYIGGAVIIGAVGYAWFFRSPPEEEVETPADPYDVGDVGYSSGWQSGGYQMPGGGSTVEPSDPPDPSTSPPINNVTWTLQATDRLAAQGYDAALIASALGKYLAKVSLNAKDVELVRFALAAVGPPPQGTYPVLQDAPPPTAPPKVPAVLPAPGNFRNVGVTKRTATFRWNTVKDAAGYRIYHDKSSGNVGHSIDGYIKVSDLSPNTTYKFHVRTMSPSGKYGPKSTTRTIRTKR